MKRDKLASSNKQIFGVTTAIRTAVVIAIAVFVVMLCYKINWSYDMTIGQLFTMSQQSVKFLSNLNEDVRIVGVYPAGQEEPMVKSLLDEYMKATDKIKVEYIDAEQNPAKLAGLNTNMPSVPNGSIIVECGTRTKIINDAGLYEDTGDGRIFNGEREFTGAIRYVTSKNLPVIYFVLGDGETDPSVSLTKAVSGLEQDAFEVRTLRLTEGNTIPDDAAMLIFVSPKSDIPADGLNMLDAYIRNGGSIFLMVDSVMNSNETVYTNLNKLTNNFGIGITNNYVVEEDSAHYLSQYKLYLIPQFGEHEITKQIAEQNRMVILPVARGLGTIDYDKSEVTNTVLMQSSDKSWIRADMTITDAERTKNDFLGPAPLAFSSVKSNIKWGKDAARMVVVGNSSFIHDGNIEVQANRDFFLNCALWLSGNREQDVIPSKVMNGGTIIIRGSQFTGLAIVCLVVLPGLAFLAAFLVWIIRRNQ